MDERGGSDGFAFQDENCRTTDSPPGAPASGDRAAEISEQEERAVLVHRLGSPPRHGDVCLEGCLCSLDLHRAAGTREKPAEEPRSYPSRVSSKFCMTRPS